MQAIWVPRASPADTVIRLRSHLLHAVNCSFWGPKSNPWLEVCVHLWGAGEGVDLFFMFRPWGQHQDCKGPPHPPKKLAVSDLELVLMLSAKAALPGENEGVGCVAFRELGFGPHCPPQEHAWGKEVPLPGLQLLVQWEPGNRQSPQRECGLLAAALGSWRMPQREVQVFVTSAEDGAAPGFFLQLVTVNSTHARPQEGKQARAGIGCWRPNQGKPPHSLL